MSPYPARLSPNRYPPHTTSDPTHGQIVQADELWCFVGMKEKTKTRKGIEDSEIGDAYTVLAVERDSKLLLAQHVGRRTAKDAGIFAAKLAGAVGEDRFQISTDVSSPTSAPWRTTSADKSTLPRSSNPTQERGWTANGGILRRP